MNEPKIALLDIETSPLVAYSWGPKWETNLVEFIEHTRILSYSVKWLGGTHLTKGWPDYKGYKKGKLDDTAITKDLWNILQEADQVVAHNGKCFDTKTINSRFIFHGLGMPSPYKVVDTLSEVRKYFRLPSNSLDDVCDYFGIGRKLHHEGFSLWKACLAGDSKAWTTMKAYNKHDVSLLEKLYLLVRPLMKSHLNLGMFTEKVVCPNCGSGKLQARGFTRNKTTKYRRLFCTNCGSWSRDNTNIQEVKPLVIV